LVTAVPGRVAPFEPADSQRDDGTTPIAFVRFPSTREGDGRVRSVRVRTLEVEGMLGGYQRRLCFLNPYYEFE
jgi:hypothetical protein